MAIPTESLKLAELLIRSGKDSTFLCAGTSYSYLFVVLVHDVPLVGEI